MDRRDALKAALLGVSYLAFSPSPGLAVPQADGNVRLAALERRFGGRLGVSIIDTGTGRRYAWRGDERFRLCSTFKLLLAAAVLARVDQGQEELQRHLVISPDALVPHSPVTELHVGTPGMTVASLCEATVTVSDNAAANLLLETMGGPAGLTAFLRGTGDKVTRLDRNEPALNRGDGPADLRDTTTPHAMLATMRRLLTANVLESPSREQLLDWLRATRTGIDALRAHLPDGWTAGDKTGSDGVEQNNDVAILWPPQGHAPILVTAYYAHAGIDTAGRKQVLAEVGRIAASL